jgi:hypothetical protein
MTKSSAMPPVRNPQTSAAAGQLADCLQARGYQATVLDSPAGPVRIKVSNPEASALTETVIIHGGAFWWSWRDQIGTDPPEAADIIARVLAVRV